MAPVPAFAAGNGKRASAASKDAGPSCRTSLRSARVASSARFGADGTRAPMVRVTHLLEPCGRPSWLLSGASTALCLPRSGQLGRVFTSGRGSVRTGSIPHSIPSLLHRAEHEEKPAGAYADKRGRRRLRAQMTLRGALNTRREDGGAAPVRAARRERGTSLEFPGPGSAQAGLTARSGRQVNFSFKGNGIGDCRPDAACIPLSAGAVAGAGCSAGGPVAMLLRSSRFGSGHDRRKGGGQRSSWPHGFAGAASLMSGSRFENGAAHRGGPVGRRGRLGEGSVRRVPGRLLNKMGFSPTLRQWGGGHKNR